MEPRDIDRPTALMHETWTTKAMDILEASVPMTKFDLYQRLVEHGHEMTLEALRQWLSKQRRKGVLDIDRNQNELLWFIIKS